MRNLLVIPSIDIKNRKAVRVVRGIPELNCSAYGNDPVEMAMIWRAENSKVVHIVDFNAAHNHSHVNFDIIKQICESVIIPVEYGGGIKTLEDAEQAFDLGVFRIVIGTLAYENKDEFVKILNKYSPFKVVAAIDVIEGDVVIKGRSMQTGISAVDYAKELEAMGVARIILTDVKSNGMMRGPNIALANIIAENTNLKITLSGGLSGYRDLHNVQTKGDPQIDSVIIGRALYENRFPCQKIWRVAESGIFN